MSNHPHDAETYAIIGAAIEVHKVLVPGFLESVYQEALELEFIERGIPYQRETQLLVHYKDKLLKTRFRSDFVCHGNISVELKAISTMTGADDAQLINYLKAIRCKRGLLLNFGASSLEIRRRVL
ncbi:MAG: GxxExxY protein [Flavobacteriales bacterium]